MIPTATVGPLWGSEIQPELRSWREPSGEHSKPSITYWADDSTGYCWPSPGLGNTAGAEILEGAVWGAFKIEHYVRGRMIQPATVCPLWGSEIQPELRS